MRCEGCGRDIRNAEMWQLSGGRNAPSARTMRVLCRGCRVSVNTVGVASRGQDVVDQANEIVRSILPGA